MSYTLNETALELLETLQTTDNGNLHALATVAQGNEKYVREMKMNIKSTLESKHLSTKETALLALSIAANEKNHILVDAFATKARDAEATEEEIAEMSAIASLLSVNNVLYRFRHYVGKDEYSKAPARLRMGLMMRPVSSKEFFELVSLAVSAVNGCEMCVGAHEESVLQAGGTTERVWDAIRLSSVVRGLSTLIH